MEPTDLDLLSNKLPSQYFNFTSYKHEFYIKNLILDYTSECKPLWFTVYKF